MNKMDKTIMKKSRMKMKMPSKILKLRLKMKMINDQDEDEDLQELVGAFVQFMRAGKKMRSKSKGWKKSPKGKRKGKNSSSSSGPTRTNAAGKKTGKCLDCGKYGHRKGDSECEHVKSGKTKPFRPHGANVLTQHYRLDADDEEEGKHDQDLRDAIMNSVNEVHGASTEGQTCVVSSLTAASSTDPSSSQHQLMDKATGATETSNSPPGRWRRAQAKRVREERTEKAAWEEQFEEKVYKMAEESVKRQLHDVKRQPRPAPPPLPASVPKTNTAEPINPIKRARKLRIRGEDVNSTFSPSDSDENPWANLPAWTPPPAAPPRVADDFAPPLPKKPWQPPQPPPTKAPPPTKVPPPTKAPPPMKAPPTRPSSINVVKKTWTRTTTSRHLLRHSGIQHHRHHQGLSSTPKVDT